MNDQNTESTGLSEPENNSQGKTEAKPRRRRWGDRRDGRLVRSLSPMSKVSPFIMVNRSGSQNFIRDSVDMTKVEDYIIEKKRSGMPRFSVMHVFIAAYIRTISQRPAINRFIGGQKIFARNNIEVMLTIKKEMTLESPDTVVKAYFNPDATADDVYRQLDKIVEDYRNNPGSDFDKTAKVFNYIPRLFMKFCIWLLKTLDYFGLLPRFLTRVSPFHGSFFITSMGSLGIPPIYHHLYDFGNVPVFLSFGMKRHKLVLNNGKVEKAPFVDFTVVTDERICDGFYFASGLKMLKNILKSPSVLDAPPEKVVEDID